MAKLDSFEPLRVTARLRCGVVCDEYVPLDGILFYQAMRERYGPRERSLPGGGVDEAALASVSMPLEIRGDGDHWYYACSFAYPQPFGSAQGWWLAEAQDHWNKRFDPQYADMVDFAGKRGKVIVEKGQYRAYHMPVFYRVAEKIEWYCVGDKARIAQLLSTVTHIGKKSVQGWGRVIEWAVEPHADDWSCWRDHRPMRAMPAEEVAQRNVIANLRYYGLRPSYYDHRNQMMVAVP